MSLPPYNEEAQSTSLPDAAPSTPVTYRQVLGLGLGLGGALHMLCAPALANMRANDVQPAADDGDRSRAQSRAQFQAQIDRVDRGIAEDNLSTAPTHPSGNQPLLSPGSLEREPRLSGKNIRQQNRLEAAAPQKIAPQFSVAEVSTTQQPDQDSELAAINASSSSPDSRSSDGNLQPWSVNALSATDSAAGAINPTQTLSVLDIQNVELAWGEVPTTDAGGWISAAQEPLAVASGPLPDVPEIGSASASVETFADIDGGATSLDLELPAIVIAESRIEVAEVEVAEGDSLQERLRQRSAQEAGNENIDLLSGILSDEGVMAQVWPMLDDELGTLRMVQLRSRENEELGILRLMQTAEANAPAEKAPAAPVAILGGRLGYVNVENVFRSTERIQEQVYQTGLSLYLFPRLSESTSLYAIADANIARYNTFSDVSNPDSRGIQLDYNEVQLQAGVRQRLLPRTYAQLGWRNQQLYSPGYREKLFGVNYLDALVSHRSIVSPKVWVDSFYQMRLGFADPQEASRFRQTLTFSVNYGITRDFRTSLLYQLDFDDYTQINRYDTYQQVLGIVSYGITPESRISLFAGTRFGRSSSPNIDLDDTFYGAGLNVSVPLF